MKEAIRMFLKRVISVYTHKAVRDFLEMALMFILLAIYFPTLCFFMRDWNRPDLGKLVFINTVIVVGFTVAGFLQIGLNGLSQLLQ